MIITKRFIIFFSCCLISISKEVEYKCANEAQIDTCYMEKTENGKNVIYVETCPKGQECLIEEDNIGKCKAPLLVWFGSPCTKNTECKTGLCEQNRCVSQKKNNEDCKSTEDCPINANYMTPQNKCLQLVEPESTCYKDEDCIIGYACDISKGNNTGKCKKMFEKQIGESSTNEMLCSSGRVITDNKGDSFCAQYEEPDSKCEIKANAINNTACYCNLTIKGINPLANKYVECEKNYLGNYVCVTQKTEALIKYITLFKEIYASLSENDKNSRATDRYYLNNDSLKEAYEGIRYFFKFQTRRTMCEK